MKNYTQVLASSALTVPGVCVDESSFTESDSFTESVSAEKINNTACRCESELTCLAPCPKFLLIC